MKRYTCGIEQMTQVPVMGPLLRQKFYDYSLTGFKVVSAMFDISLQVEHNVTHGETPSENLCIQCDHEAVN